MARRRFHYETAEELSAAADTLNGKIKQLRADIQELGLGTARRTADPAAQELQRQLRLLEEDKDYALQQALIHAVLGNTPGED